MDAPTYSWVCLSCSHVNLPGKHACMQCRLPCRLTATEIAQGRADLVQHREPVDDQRSLPRRAAERILEWIILLIP